MLLFNLGVLHDDNTMGKVHIVHLGQEAAERQCEMQRFSLVHIWKTKGGGLKEMSSLTICFKDIEVVDKDENILTLVSDGSFKDAGR